MTERKDTATWYLRMFSYLLMICGAFGIATAAVVGYQAVADCSADGSGLSLGSVAFGLASLAANGVTVAAGILGRAASRNPDRLPALCTLALAGIVTTALGLGLCYAAGSGTPTSLLFNGLIMVICAVVASNLRKSPSQD